MILEAAVNFYSPQRRFPWRRAMKALFFMALFSASMFLLILRESGDNKASCPPESVAADGACVAWTPTTTTSASTQPTPPDQSMTPANGDADNDGIPDDQDNCPEQPNNNQEDRDGDGFGAACDGDDATTPIPNVLSVPTPVEPTATTQFLADAPSTASSEQPPVEPTATTRLLADVPATESSGQPPVPPAAALGAWEEFATNISGGQQIILPRNPVEPNELYLAHGDIDGTGSCAYRIFDTGETIAGLSTATWRLEQLSGGTHDQRIAEAQARGRQMCGQ